jgi:hypothetical protein
MKVLIFCWGRENFNHQVWMKFVSFVGLLKKKEHRI